MIRNKTKNKILVSKIEKAESFFAKAKGLMFRSEFPKDSGMLFTFDNEGFVGIWMLFMRFPIDMVYLDSEKRIVGIYENIIPVSMNPKTWKVYYPEIPAKYILELNSGLVKESKTEIGDILDFS